MPHEESLYPPHWLRVAEKDLDRVRRMLEDADADAAGFYLQQAVEKTLKAYLLSQSWALRRIHDLDALLSDVVRYLPECEVYRPVCQRITDFYLVDRYPFMLDSGLDLDDVNTALSAVQPLFETIRGILKKS